MVRQRGEEFTPDQLQAKKAVTAMDPQTGTEVVISEADPLFGINKLLAALESINGKTDLDKKGELRSQFYLELKRKPGERISEFCTRFRTLTADLRAEGIQLHEAELGWFLRDKLGLDPLRKQLLEMALNGRDTYDAVEAEVLRLFKDLHSADPLQRKSFGGGDGKPSLMHRFLSTASASSGRPSTSALWSSGSAVSKPSRSFASSSISSRSNFKPRTAVAPRQSYVAENDEADEVEDGDEEMIPDDGGGTLPALEEVLQAEAAQLASDLEALEADGMEPELLEELESGVENAAEALVSMREARAKINDVKRDRGYGRAGVGSASSKPHGNQVNKAKLNTKCFDCNQPGHWAGDKECTKPGAGLGKKDKKVGGKQVMISESMNTEYVIPSALSPEDVSEAHEVHAVVAAHLPARGSLSEVLASSQPMESPPEASPALELSRDKRLVGALDSACNRTVTGSTWLTGFLNELKKAPVEVRSLIQRQQEKELFRFGNGGVQQSVERWRLPMMIGDTLFVFWTSVVDVPSLGLLFGRDFLDGVGAVLNFNRRLLRCDRLGTSCIPLRQMSAGHFLLDIIPKTWSRPGSAKWRKFGQDGVVEMQMSASDWVLQKFGHSNNVFPKEHEHLLTENSILAANLANSGLKQCSTDRTALVALARDVMTTVSERSPIRTSTSRPTRATTLTSSVPTRSDGSAKQAKGCQRLASGGSQNGRPRILAHPGLVALAAAAAWASLGASSIPSNWQRPAVACPSGKHVCLQGAAEAPLRQSPSTWNVHSTEPGGRSFLAKSDGFRAGLPGGPALDGHVSGQSRQWYGSEDSSRSSQRSQSRGRGSSQGRTSTSCRSRVDWPAWGTSHTQKGSFETGRPTSRHSGGKGHRAEDPRALQTNGRPSAEGQGQGASSRGLQSQVGDCPGRSEIHGERTVPSSRSSMADPGPSGSLCATASTSSADDGGSGGKVSRYVVAGVSTCDVDAEQPQCARASGSGKGRRLCHGGERKLVSHRVRKDQNPGGLPRRDEGGKDSDGWIELRKPIRVKEANDAVQWSLHQNLKKGTAQMISQAWQQHEKDRQLVSKTPKEIFEVFETQWLDDMEKGMNETFMASVRLCSQPLVTEVYSHTERVKKEARKRGHRTGDTMSLETGFNFLLPEDRERAKQQVRRERPYFLLIAFPCGPWSPLLRLNSNVDLARIQEQGAVLMNFALELAEIQLAGNWHYILENPKPSAAWKRPEMLKFLDEHENYVADFHQCRFGLKGSTGLPHQKATRMASSSRLVSQLLDGQKCIEVIMCINL